MNSDYLFVYGTLQNGLDNEMSRYLISNSNVVDKGHIYGKLYKISWFPGAILSSEASERVYGTVFKLRNLEEIFMPLDAYEGFEVDNPDKSLFIRKTTTVFLENGGSVTAWVYLYNQTLKDKRQILSGDFLKNAKA